MSCLLRTMAFQTGPIGLIQTMVSRGHGMSCLPHQGGSHRGETEARPPSRPKTH